MFTTYLLLPARKFFINESVKDHFKRSSLSHDLSLCNCEDVRKRAVVEFFFIEEWFKTTVWFKTMLSEMCVFVCVQVSVGSM